MDIYMVGVYKQKNKIVGFKMLDPNNADPSKRVMDVQYNQVVSVLQSKSANIVNLKIENGKIKGYNGSLDRYGVIGKSQALVIIKKATDKNDTMLGYICSDCNGNMKLLTEQQVIDFANKIALANGKVVTDASGKSYISAIEGTYQLYKKQQTTQTNQTQQTPQPNYLDEETVDVINKLRTYKEYKGSYAEKIVGTIKKLNNRCTEKQKDCLKKILSDLESKYNKQNETPTKTQKQQPNEIQTPKRVIEQSSADIFNIEIMNNQLYIKSLTKEARGVHKNIVIPDVINYNGKDYMVKGILGGAFSNTGIEYVKTGSNLSDIGQGAFQNCVNLAEVDLSLSNHPHIPMNCFNGCKNLKSVRVGNKVQRIHEAAFCDCVLLRKIELPSSTDTIARIAFLNCQKLESVDSSVVTINDSAFRECHSLKQFNFSNVINIGAQAFRYTAFRKLVLPGNITSIGTKAFSDIYELSDVELCDGIEVIGDYCFAKSEKGKVDRTRNYRQTVAIESILTCKSLKEIGAGAFRHAELVKVYTGSVAESHCIGFDVPYIRLDDSNLDNSTKVRIKSELIESNPMKILYETLITPGEGASNPNIQLNTSKLVDIQFGKQNFDFFHIEETTEKVEPHVKFIGLLNYLQDVGDLYQDPLSNGVLRLQKTFNVVSDAIFNDGCNRVYKVMYQLVDTLDDGGFIMVIMDNHLKFITELNIATDVNVGESLANDENIPIKKYVHAGDKLGKTSTISGHNGLIIVDDNQVNVGEMFFNRISEHAIEIIPQRKDSIWYIPATGLSLKLHDKREWEKDNYSKTGKKIARNSEDCLNVLQILTYEELVAMSKNYKKHTVDSGKFFKQLNSMSKNEVDNRINSLASVEEEKEAQLFHVSNEFRAILSNKGVNLDSASPNDLTIDLFYDISQSYWMIEKDQDWLRLTGQKSLSKTNEYIISGYRLVEYKSNQVVKFSNPYMNGQKGAFVFTLIQKNMTRGVYASRHSMQHIVDKLVKLTQMKPDTVPMNLMQDAYNIDMCSHDLFYNFYDVLYSKDGWSFKNYISGYNKYVWNSNADFHIAMYKPTGVFYLTMESYVKTPNGETGRRTMPVLPIGNMDRALMIATTTNSKNKDSKLLEELMVLATSVIMRASGIDRKATFKFDTEYDIDAYFKARELAIQGVKDINLYKQLVNDRVVYMLGTIHKGVLQRENSYNDLDIEVEDTEADYYTEEDTDIDIDLDEDIDIDITGEDEEELYEDEEELYEDEEDIDDYTGVSDTVAIELQKQLKAAGHDLNIAQVKLMLAQQMNK